jgi:hypothetical protein
LRSIDLMYSSHQRSFGVQSRTGWDQAIPPVVSEQQPEYVGVSVYQIMAVYANDEIEPGLQCQFFICVAQHLEAIRSVGRPCVDLWRRGLAVEPSYEAIESAKHFEWPATTSTTEKANLHVDRRWTISAETTTRERSKDAPNFPAAHKAISRSCFPPSRPLNR